MVCFGGPLSYVLGEADAALDELLRVTKPGGHVLLSVMSLLGAARAFFDQLPPLVDEFGWKRAVTDIFETGDLDGEINKGHVCRLYRWSSLEALLERHPCRIVTASAANFLSVANDALGRPLPRGRDRSVSVSQARWTAGRTSSPSSSESDQSFVGVGESEGGLDDADVRERLREVPEEAAALGVVLLGDQAEVVPQREQPLEERDRLVLPALLSEHCGEPERAGEEHALAGREAVDVGVLLVGAVALDEAAAHELLLDRAYGADDALVLRRQEADERDQEAARVEAVRAEELGERAALGVVALAETSSLDRLRGRPSSARAGPPARSARPS